MSRKSWLGIAFAALAALVVVGIFTPPQALANDRKTVSYLDRWWDGSSVQQQWKSANAEVLDDIDSDHYTLSGWYVVEKSFSDGDRPTVSGTCNIILKDKDGDDDDNLEMSLRDGIHVPPGATLNIYAGGGAESGKLLVGRSKADTAAIGGNSGESSGTINIHSGTINVTGGSHTNHGGAGIGGGWKGSGTVNIFGGNITAKGGNEAAGIGGGSNKEGNDSTGGAGNNIKIYGGTVNASGWWGAGIGGGEYGKGGTIQILGGDITAVGGADAAGIGGGEERDGGNITISGGNVNATGGSLTNKGGAGIGGGGKGGSGTITISGGTVKAIGGAFASGIGGGDGGEGNNIKISDGTVTAIANTQNSNGGGGAAGIGGGDGAAGKNITISGGTVSATGGTKLSVNGGAGIGGGSKHNGENIIISYPANITKAQGGADAAGIGGGDNGEGKSIRITGGTVKANGGSDKDGGGAGIGGGQGKSASVTITGGSVTATGGGDGAGIGGGEKGGGDNVIDITGGSVTANGGSSGAGIGGGQDAGGGSITISESPYIDAKGGEYGAGIGGGEEGENAGTILIQGGNITAKGGNEASGIGGGSKGGRDGSVRIENGTVNATGGRFGAGIGTGRWSRFHGSSYYSSAVGVTVTGGNVNAWGDCGGAGIGGGYMGPSGKLQISGGNVYAKGGYNGGAGIGTGCSCFKDDVTTTDVTISDGKIKAVAGDMDGAINNMQALPGAAIGTGGAELSASIGGAKSASYFIGDIYFSGGTVEAYSADVTKSPGTNKDAMCVIGTSDADERDWYSKGFVHFNGSTVDMYPGPGTPNGSIKQMVRASELEKGGIKFTDTGGLYQRVDYATQVGDVNNMKEAKDTSRYLVLTGADGVEDFDGSKETVNEYKRVRVMSVHKHDLEYSLKEGSTDTIVVKCAGAGHSDCKIPVAGGELTIARPTLQTYRQAGASAEAVVTDVYKIRNGAKVQYYKANDTGTDKGDQLDQAPSVPGKYWAQITLPDTAEEGDPDSATAHVVYDIARATAETQVNVEVKQSVNLAEGIKSLLPIEDGDWENASSEFDPSSTATGCTVEGGMLTAGDTEGDAIVNVSFRDAGGGVTMTAKVTAHVIRKKAQVIEADDVNVVLGETGARIDAAVTTPASGGGALSYAVKADGWDIDYDDPADAPVAVDAETGELSIRRLGAAYVTITAEPVDVGGVQYGTTTKDVKVTVTKNTYDPTVTMDNWTYGETAKVPTIEGLPTDLGIVPTYEYKPLNAGDYEYTTGKPTQAGDYVVRATIAETGTYEGATCTDEFSIAKRPIGVTISADDREYDGTTEATVYAQASGDDQKGAIEGVTASGLIEGDSYIILGVTGAFATPDAGVDKALAVDTSGAAAFGVNADNYDPQVVGSPTATINKAWAVVMADDVYVPVSEPLPEELTATVYTAVEGETILYDLACNAEAGKIGEYEIVVYVDPEREGNKNYEVWCVNGVLAITRALSVTATGYSGAYDGQPHGINVDVKIPESAWSDISWFDSLTDEDLAVLTAWAVAAGIEELILPEDNWTDAQWAEWETWAKRVGLYDALNNLEWATVLYSTEEITRENIWDVTSTTNPTYTDVGTYRVYYAVVALDGETVLGSKDVVITKAEPTVTAPTPVEGLYKTGEPQALVTGGSVTGGTLEYSLDGTDWSTDVPTATEPGSYAVFYRVTGDANHKDVAPKTVVVTIAEKGPAARGKAMYRLYNPNSGEHFYTASGAERDHLAVIGWRYEGTGWVAPEEGAPVYRLYNPNAGDHHYTMSVAERDFLIDVGWNDEGVGWNSAGDDGVPLWRQYNPNAVAGAHNYTTDGSERDMLVSIGWAHEGVGWYGLDVSPYED